MAALRILPRQSNPSSFSLVRLMRHLDYQFQSFSCLVSHLISLIWPDCVKPQPTYAYGLRSGSFSCPMRERNTTNLTKSDIYNGDEKLSTGLYRPYQEVYLEFRLPITFCPEYVGLSLSCRQAIKGCAAYKDSNLATAVSHDEY